MIFNNCISWNVLISLRKISQLTLRCFFIYSYQNGLPWVHWPLIQYLNEGNQGFSLTNTFYLLSIILAPMLINHMNNSLFDFLGSLVLFKWILLKKSMESLEVGLFILFNFLYIQYCIGKEKIFIVNPIVSDGINCILFVEFFNAMQQCIYDSNFKI